MKKLFAMLLILAMALSCAAACAEAGGDQIECAIEDGGYVIRIADPSGDLGWIADDMAGDDSVVKLAGAEPEDGAFVVRYAPTGDGEASVRVMHYIGIACDRMYDWDLKVEDGAVTESTGGGCTVSPDAAEQDPYLSGEWLEYETQFSRMTIERNESGRGWDVEIASPLTHGAYVFKTTIYFDCALNCFLYDKGKFWDVPITDSDEEAPLGEAAVAGTTGSFTFVGDPGNPLLSWVDDQKQDEVIFEPVDAASVADAEDAEDPVAPYLGRWVSDRITLEMEGREDGAACTIRWPNSAFDVTEWTYDSCMYDEVADELNTMEIGVKSVVTYGEGGVVESSEVLYDDGAASFALDDEGRLVWTDYKETPGENTHVFERAADLDQPESAGETLHASIQHVVDSPEWVTALPEAQDDAVTQLFIVAGIGMDNTTASISMHERGEDGAWQQILSTPGYVGKNGLCPDAEHAEGCAQTPVGTYHFNRAFGIAPDPGCAIPYFQVDDNTYWSGDPDRQYNQMVDIRDVPELVMDDSEHIVDYEYQYQYCLNISFNEDGTPGRGSAIFLHCLGPAKPWTGGCVAIPENIMKLVMQNVREDCVVVIDTLDDMGGSL